jgi:hypothetical protein
MNRETTTGCGSLYGITHQSLSTRYVIVSLPTFLPFQVEKRYGMIRTKGGSGKFSVMIHF